MTGFLGASYLWVKAAHVVFVIFWMASMFILPRYLIHHQQALGDAVQEKLWIDREATLRRMIITPSILMVWVLGALLAVNIGLFDGFAGLGWLHAKIALVFILSGYHGWAVGYSKKLARGEARLSDRQLRIANEIPALFVVLIVILVIVRPF
ncbi:CopD family protein [Hephaestia sp. GCM10023244]|uniref:CopD family protein n=1 Tax=unclassified Hephaestia TaxID=2631281 RepID=UPI0020778342|nr:CopD family protein [Hephaestia sp. MAHUQ-44]MCM8731154.1 CopD family protein [Hephaestia sp. MAHUQ-44]